MPVLALGVRRVSWTLLRAVGGWRRVALDVRGRPLPPATTSQNRHRRTALLSEVSSVLLIRTDAN